MLFIVLLIVVAIICFITSKNTDDDPFSFGVGIILSAGIVLSIFSILICNTKTHIINERYELQNLSNSINTQINYYKNTGILPENLLWDIEEYNENVNYGKLYQKNIWVGAFTPNIYNDFELINFEIKEIK